VTSVTEKIRPAPTFDEHALAPRFPTPTASRALRLSRIVKMEIAASVVGLASGVLSVGGSIYTLVGKYRDVPEFVQQLQTGWIAAFFPASQRDCTALHKTAPAQPTWKYFKKSPRSCSIRSGTSKGCFPKAMLGTSSVA
jgi:hypothetical protein